MRNILHRGTVDFDSKLNKPDNGPATALTRCNENLSESPEFRTPRNNPANKMRNIRHRVAVDSEYKLNKPDNESAAALTRLKICPNWPGSLLFEARSTIPKIKRAHHEEKKDNGIRTRVHARRRVEEGKKKALARKLSLGPESNGRLLLYIDTDHPPPSRSMP
ncbi:hypothetical protein B0H13DRAFT_1902328 [Mycena leptocephala]|nr:hypothetical protein B0H13DRAFT_1902328 [Mycena leptocephala]